MLTPLDGLDNSEEFTTTTIRNSVGSVTLVLSSLPFRRVFNSAVLAYGCAQHSLVDNGIEIGELSEQSILWRLYVMNDNHCAGTHDVYNTSIVSVSGVVSVTGDIISESTLRGILVIAYSLTNDTNTHYMLNTFLPDQLRVNAMLMGLPAGQYQLSLFVIEQSGLPFSRAAATPKSVQVYGKGS